MPKYKIIALLPPHAAKRNNAFAPLYVNNQLECTSTLFTAGKVVNSPSKESISKMTECSEPIAVKDSDTIKVEGTYDTKAHPL